MASNFVFQNGSTVLNESGEDNDFRVESDTNTHAFFLEGSSGNVGIGTSSPDSYNVLGGTITAIANSNVSSLSIVSGASSTGNILFADGTAGDARRAGRIAYDHSLNNLYFFTNGNSLKATIDSSGNLGLGVTPSAWDSSFKPLQMSLGAVFSGRTNDVTDAWMGANWYFNGSQDTFIGTGYATRYRQQGGSHKWYMSTGSGTAGNAITFTQAMTLDASGNLGIGTTSPTAKLESAGNIGFGTGGTFAAGQIYSDANWGVIFRAKQASPALAEFGFFNAGGTERARIDASGNLLVGTTSNIGVSVLSVYSPNLATTANGIGIKNGTDNTGGYFLSFKKSDNTTIGSIVQGVNSVSYVTSSDYRLKEDWVAVADASTRVNALKPVNFAWKATGDRVDGFLAHELAEVVPEAVTGEKDAVDDEGSPVYQAIDQSKLVPLLTAALQEALAEINTLKARLDAAGL